MVRHTIEVPLECCWFYLQIVQECKQNSWKKIFKKKTEKKEEEEEEDILSRNSIERGDIRFEK
jgi:hypothetical protein